MKPIKRIFPVVLLSLLSLVSCIDDKPEEGANLQVGDNIPAFSVVLTDGTIVSNLTLSGMPALIVFFNTGCADCRHELPVVEQFYQYLQKQNDTGSQLKPAENKLAETCNVVCISREQSEEDVAAYWYANGFTMPYSAQPDRRIYELFAQSRIPRVYAVNEKGIIIAMWDDTDMPTLEDLQKAFL